LISLRTVFKRGALTLALATLAAGCGGSSGPPSAPQRPPLISIFEAPTQLATAPGPAVDELRHLGAGYVRLVVRWSAVAPSARPGGFDAASPSAYPAAGWAPYDAIVRDATSRGLGVLLDIFGPAPPWATGHGAPPGGVPGVWKPSASQFGSFAHAVGVRYSGRYTPPGSSAPLPRIKFWSIWNEPNLGQADLAPQAIGNSTIEASPAIYRRLLDAGWSALQGTGHGSDTILIGELAPYGQMFGNFPGNFGEMVPLRFVRALYCVDSSLRPLSGAAAAARDCPTTAAASKRFAGEHPALFHAGGFAIHPYPSAGVAPNVVLPVGPDFVYLATLGRLGHALDALTGLYGASKQFPFYSTEYGYFTNPPLQGAAPPPLAATYLNWAEYISWRDPRVRSFDQYLLVDPPPGPSKFVTGLEFYGGIHKPSYDAWRMPIYLPYTRQGSGHALEVWGCVRPAHYAALDSGRPQRVQIELQAGSGGLFKAVKTAPLSDPSCYFDTSVAFGSGGTVRLAWSYPHGPTIYSRTVTITTH
jgi:hypothetical protein